jgi:CIC family chloride channel protein
LARNEKRDPPDITVKLCFPRILRTGVASIIDKDYPGGPFPVSHALVVRAVMTFLSYSIGVPGGILAPMLALGTLIGLSFGCLAQDVFPNTAFLSGSFAIAAMGALFAATVRAPLTGIVLVAEMTDSFELLPALIITCMAASITSEFLGNKPIYDLLLARTLDHARTCRERDE